MGFTVAFSWFPKFSSTWGSPLAGQRVQARYGDRAKLARRVSPLVHQRFRWNCFEIPYVLGDFAYFALLACWSASGSIHGACQSIVVSRCTSTGCTFLPVLTCLRPVAAVHSLPCRGGHKSERSKERSGEILKRQRKLSATEIAYELKLVTMVVIVI
eukprot:119465-Amphidinium_carterae.1